MAEHEFAAAWGALDPSARRCLELADQTLVSGGLAVGAVLANERNEIVAEGRNRCYDPTTGTDPLEGTPVAHAEMNAFARLAADERTDTLTLWSTHRPCTMCQAAAEFIGIPTIRAIAPDPSDPGSAIDEVVDPVWVVAANLMFLLGPILRGGSAHPLVVAYKSVEPEIVDLAVGLTPEQRRTILDSRRPLTDRLEVIWPDVVRAGDLRRRRGGLAGRTSTS